MQRRQVLSIGLAWACAAVVQAFAGESGRPASVLIATNAVNGTGLKPDRREMFERIYNEYMRMIIESMQQQFRAAGVPVEIYVHRNPATGRKVAVIERMLRGRHVALMQLDYQFEGGPTGNRTLVNCSYMRVEMRSGQNGGGTFGPAVAKSYIVMGENVSEGPGASTIAADFFHRVRNANFSPAR